MKRVAFVGLALCVFLGVFGQAAVGQEPTASTQGSTTPGQIRFVGSRGCALEFEFRGFPAGAQGQVQLYFKSHLVHTFVFDLPTPSGVVNLQAVGIYIPHPAHRNGKTFHGTVGFRATAQGSNEVVTGLVDITCYCSGEGGGGTVGSGGSDTGTGLPDSPPASPVSLQPGFTG
jgi:hypothetical protein